AMGSGREERAQGAPLGVELLGLPPQVEEDLLGDFLGRRFGAQDLAGARAWTAPPWRRYTSARAGSCQRATATTRLASLACSRSIGTDPIRSGAPVRMNERVGLHLSP